MPTLPRRAKILLTAGGVVCTAAGGIVLWKDMLGGDTDTGAKVHTKSQEGNVYVVTGANSGIGKAVAWDLAKAKAKVYMACRDMDKCETARKEIVIDTRNKYCNIFSL